MDTLEDSDLDEPFHQAVAARSDTEWPDSTNAMQSWACAPGRSF
jgi:hypothetical protein